MLLRMIVAWAVVGVVAPSAAGLEVERIAFASSRDRAPGMRRADSESAALFVMNPDGTEVRQVVRLRGMGVREFSWSPDRTRLAVAVGDEGFVFTDLAVVDLHGGVMWLTRSRKSVSSTHPAWSPRGDLIAFASNRGGQAKGSRIFTVRPDGSGLMQVSPQRVFGLSKYPPFDRSPTWSPEGTRIAFACWEGLCVQGIGARTVTPLAKGYTRNPAWSPDGSRIAFDRPDSGSNGDIWTVDAEGGIPRVLTNTRGVGEIAAAWSPDGSTIAYQRTAPKNQDIWAMRADGTHRTPLAPAQGYDGQPAWSQ